jgi:hypothetical protein
VVRLNNLVGPKGLGLGGEQLLTVAHRCCKPTNANIFACQLLCCLSIML